MSASRFFLSAAIGLAILVLSVCTIAVFTGNLGRPIRWDLPPGYRGWVVVQYGNIACQPLSKNGLYLVVRITPSGHACTSSPIPTGWRYERYEYLDGNG